MYWVYVIESIGRRFRVNGLGGPFYVGVSRDPAVSLLLHNGQLPGGQEFFVSLRPWEARALYGPYSSEAAARAAAKTVKSFKRKDRARWEDGGQGNQHPWVFNSALRPHQF